MQSLKAFVAALLLSIGLIAVIAPFIPPVYAQTTTNLGYAGKETTVSLTADNQAVDPAGYGVLLVTSDNATATNRTFTLTASPVVGHKVTLVFTHASNACEIAVTSTQKLSATWSPAQYDTLTLVSDGTRWIEVSRADNSP